MFRFLLKKRLKGYFLADSWWTDGETDENMFKCVCSCQGSRYTAAGKCGKLVLLFTEAITERLLIISRMNLFTFWSQGRWCKQRLKAEKRKTLARQKPHRHCWETDLTNWTNLCNVWFFDNKVAEKEQVFFSVCCWVSCKSAQSCKLFPFMGQCLHHGLKVDTGPRSWQHLESWLICDKHLLYWCDFKLQNKPYTRQHFTATFRSM